MKQNENDIDGYESNGILSGEDNLFDKEDASDADFQNLGSTDLSGQIPEDNDVDIDEEEKAFLAAADGASRVNVGSIFAVFFLVIAAVVLLVVLFTKLTGKEKTKDTDLDYAGGKTAPANYQLGSPKSFANNTDTDPSDKDVATMTEDEVNSIISGLSEEYQLPGQKTRPTGDGGILNVVKQGEPGVSPIRQSEAEKKEQPQQVSYPSAQPSAQQTRPISPEQHVNAETAEATTGYVKPDTRKSSSVRKIEGLAGLVGTPITSNQTPSAAQYLDPSKMSKEDYIAAQLASMQSGSGQQNSQQGGLQPDIEYDKQIFFSDEGKNNSGTGYYLAKNTIWDGTVIKGALETGINTDNPGVVIARVTENVYSSYDYSYLLIPEGTLLYATYNSSVSYGQDRVQIAWNLLIRPDGYRMELGNMNGVDSKGYSGVSGWKYNHIWEELKALGMVAVYSILNTEITRDIEKQKNAFISNAMTDVYQTTQRIANGMVERALDIKPSITVAPGTEIKLITNQPLTLPAMDPFPVSQKYVRY